MEFPENLSYTREHEWVRFDGQRATVGVTEFAVEQLGDVVYIDLPKAGTAVAAGEACGEIESTKSVSDLYAPLTGIVAETNEAVVDDPSRLNSDPYGTGWLIRVDIAETPTGLLDAADYVELVGER